MPPKPAGRNHWRWGAGLGSAAALLTVSAALAAQLPGRPLTTDPANDLRPAWSPDGTQIAFQSSRSGNNDIWLMNADGSDQHALTTDPADDRRPAWSPDGQWLAFDSDRGGSRDVWVMDAQGGQVRPLTAGPGQETFPAWSPDGTQIAYFVYAGGNLELWVVALDGFLSGAAPGAARQLVADVADERQSQCTFACHMPAWSPDGRQLAFSGSSHTAIWLVGADGSNPHSVAGAGEHNHFPTWTPDGRLLYLSERVTEKQEPVNDVWVMNADGSGARLLYPAVPHGGPLEFRPDDATIAFQSPRAGNFDIYSTVLGAEAPTAEASAEAPALAATVPPMVTADEPAPPAPTPAGARPAAVALWGGAAVLAAAGAAVLALGGGAIVYFLIRRRL